MILPLVAMITAVALWWLALDPGVGLVSRGDTLLSIVGFGFALGWTVFAVKELYELVASASSPAEG